MKLNKIKFNKIKIEVTEIINWVYIGCVEDIMEAT